MFWWGVLRTFWFGASVIYQNTWGVISLTFLPFCSEINAMLFILRQIVDNEEMNVNRRMLRAKEKL